MPIVQKEPAVSVCWRVKSSSLDWLREVARQQDRPVNWLINRLIERAREEQDAKVPA
ncbi:hypothetical protein [Paracidovorax avenae]|uniref:hypothetical protein n=1 Tax=Paracidovorax avenae TaxID=80867 RepID=UPI000A9368E8|nr:hypothetical protein [Paracidovorax avenae]